MIEKYINDYETEHGEIEIKETEKPELKIPLMDPFHTGARVGEAPADVVLNQIRRIKYDRPGNH